MKNLLNLFLFMLFVTAQFVTAQPTTADNSTRDEQTAWIQSLLSEQGESIKGNDYLFYSTGHHGIIWSLIASDSSGIHLYNGTTRARIEQETSELTDSLSFIKNNIKTISWGFDSLANASQSFSAVKDKVYNPIYNQIYVIKNGNTVFSYLDTKDRYVGPDSTNFNSKLGRLSYLLFWLASPSTRPYLPLPCDTISAH
jgi:hypothetical protein